MKDDNFKLIEMNLDRIEKNDLLEKFLATYSRFLSMPQYKFDYNTQSVIMLTYNNFETVRDEIINLAKKGERRALSFYLNNEKMEKWDKDLVEIAKEIENKKIKTPEEWEVVAGLHINDRISIFFDDRILTQRNLIDSVKFESIRFDELENQRDHCRYFDPFEEVKYTKEGFDKLLYSCYNRYRWLVKCMQGGVYSDAIKQAQIGYFQRYSIFKDNLDLSSFMELKKTPYCHYIEREIIETIDKDSYFSFWECSKILRKNCKEIFKSEKCNEEIKDLKKSGKSDVEIKKTIEELRNLKMKQHIVDKFAIARGLKLVEEEIGLSFIFGDKKIKSLLDDVRGFKYKSKSETVMKL